MAKDPHLGDKTTKTQLKDMLIMHHSIHLCQQGQAVMKMKNTVGWWGSFGCLQSSASFSGWWSKGYSFSVSLLNYTSVFSWFSVPVFYFKIKRYGTLVWLRRVCNSWSEGYEFKPHIGYRNYLNKTLKSNEKISHRLWVNICKTYIW